MHSGSSSNSHYSTFFIYGDVEVGNSERLFQIIATELREMLDQKISQREFKEARQFLVGEYHRLETTSYDLLNHYTSTYKTSDRIISYYASTMVLPKIDRDRMLLAFQSMLTNQHWYLGLLGGDQSRTIPRSTLPNNKNHLSGSLTVEGNPMPIVWAGCRVITTEALTAIFILFILNIDYVKMIFSVGFTM